MAKMGKTLIDNVQVPKKTSFLFQDTFLVLNKCPIPELILAQNLQDYFLTKNN